MKNYILQQIFSHVSVILAANDFYCFLILAEVFRAAPPNKLHVVLFKSIVLVLIIKPTKEKSIKSKLQRKLNRETEVEQLVSVIIQ